MRPTPRGGLNNKGRAGARPLALLLRWRHRRLWRRWWRRWRRRRWSKELAVQLYMCCMCPFSITHGRLRWRRWWRQWSKEDAGQFIIRVTITYICTRIIRGGLITLDYGCHLNNDNKLLLLRLITLEYATGTQHCSDFVISIHYSDLVTHLMMVGRLKWWWCALANGFCEAQRDNGSRRTWSSQAIAELTRSPRSVRELRDTPHGARSSARLCAAR